MENEKQKQKTKKELHTHFTYIIGGTYALLSALWYATTNVEYIEEQFSRT